MALLFCAFWWELWLWDWQWAEAMRRQLTQRQRGVAKKEMQVMDTYWHTWRFFGGKESPTKEFTFHSHNISWNHILGSIPKKSPNDPFYVKSHLPGTSHRTQNTPIPNDFAIGEILVDGMTVWRLRRNSFVGPSISPRSFIEMTPQNRHRALNEHNTITMASEMNREEQTKKRGKQ